MADATAQAARLETIRSRLAHFDGTSQIAPSAARTARSLIEELASRGCALPYVYPHDNATVSLEWGFDSVGLCVTVIPGSGESSPAMHIMTWNRFGADSDESSRDAKFDESHIGAAAEFLCSAMP